MTWSTYVGAIYFQGRELYYLERVDDFHLSGGYNAVLRDSSGRVALFSTESAARAEGHALNEPLREKVPYLLDLDTVLAWCSAPESATLNYGDIVQAWHTLIDFGAAAPFPDALTTPDDPDYALDVVVDKVHIGLSVISGPPSMPHLPDWSPAELSLLAETLGTGIATFAADLASRADHGPSA